MDFQPITPLRDALYLNLLALHDAEQLPVEINLVGEGHPHLRGLVDEGQSPGLMENGPIYMALRRLLPLVEIILMIVLGSVKTFYRTDLGRNLVTHPGELVDDFDGDKLLLRVGDPDGRQILRPNVDALPVGLLKVVDLEEITHQRLIGHDTRLIIDFDGLQMPRRPSLHLFVTWILDLAAHEPHRGVNHPLETLEVIFHAPKTSC